MLVSRQLLEHTGYRPPQGFCPYSLHLEYSPQISVSHLLQVSTQMSSHPGKPPLILHIRRHQLLRAAPASPCAPPHPPQSIHSQDRFCAYCYLAVSLSIRSTMGERSLFCSLQVRMQSHTHYQAFVEEVRKQKAN